MLELSNTPTKESIMAPTMSMKEMTELVLNGEAWFEFTAFQNVNDEGHNNGTFTLEIKVVGSGRDMGELKMPISRRAMDFVEETLPYTLDYLEFGMVRLIAERDRDFRAFIEQEMKP